MLGPFGGWELVFLFILALVIFGPKKLPEIGKTIGKGMREFKKATDDLKTNWEEHVRESEKDTSIQELKQTIHQVTSDVQESTADVTRQIQSHTADLTGDLKSDLESAAAHLEDKPEVSTANKDSDAHPN